MEAKFPEIVKLIERRLSEGDYCLTPIPSGRKLADEVGVNYRTARRAMKELIKKGLLVRQSNGRVTVNINKSEKPLLQVAYLAPAFMSPGATRARISLEQIAPEFNAIVRPIDYVHWDDPVVMEVLSRFDAIFISPCTEVIPPRILQSLQQNTNPVMWLGYGSDCGLPSVEFFGTQMLSRLMEYLGELGHKRIGCLNVHRDIEADRRIQLWRHWLADRGHVGMLIDAPVKPYMEATARAYDIMNQTLASGAFTGTALLCTTFQAAIGATRAFHEHGMRSGQDISICAIDGEGLARLQTPSVTSLEIVDLRQSLVSFMKYIQAHRSGRPLPRLIPPRVELFKGESTGAPAVS